MKWTVNPTVSIKNSVVIPRVNYGILVETGFPRLSQDTDPRLLVMR